jgi:hypothetical protein
MSRGLRPFTAFVVTTSHLQLTAKMVKADSPKSLEDLEGLLWNDTKVKVAGALLRAIFFRVFYG